MSSQRGEQIRMERVDRKFLKKSQSCFNYDYYSVDIFRLPYIVEFAFRQERAQNTHSLGSVISVVVTPSYCW